MSDIEKNTEIINNYRNHDSRTVIAAIDAVMVEQGTIEYGSPLYEKLQEIKWSDHYSHVIDDPDQAMHDNASFYVDFVLWRGWQAAQQHKKEHPDKGVTPNE